MSTLHTHWLPEKITYTGAELSPHWISARTKLFASSIVAFRGPCQVNTGEMVDLEDSRAGKFITSGEMLHFLGEWFDGNLELAVARQRLLIAGFAERLRDHLPADKAHALIRRGNDLFLALPGHEPAKLSVSIVTASPVSSLFHFGVNIDPSGAPVKAVGLVELGVKPEDLAKAVLQSWKEEWEGMAKARCKVAPR
ncbi:MAG: DUF366 family protein [Bdellovibrionota bacterium]